MSGQMNGIEHIAATFVSAKKEKRAALMPYFTLGYPDPATSLDVVEAIAQAGADLIELGFPFSDPLADGPTIQHSTQVALEQGVNAAQCIEMVAELRSHGVTQPFMLMGYINPILAFGVERFVAEVTEAGADGFIVPDLPPEEGAEVEAACRAHGRALVYLLAPTSPPERIELLASHTTGFLYLVSLAGVTGARDALPPHLADFIQRVRAAAYSGAVAHTPLAVGFGISTPEQARAVGQLADGVIVGSALIKAVGEAAGRDADPAKAAADFVHSLRVGLEG
jgi:tryptophan synthase alpha chain